MTAIFRRVSKHAESLLHSFIPSVYLSVCLGIHPDAPNYEKVEQMFMNM